MSIDVRVTTLDPGFMCLSYFPVVMTKHHDGGNLYKKAFSLGLMVPKSTAIMAGSMAADIALEQ